MPLLHHLPSSRAWSHGVPASSSQPSHVEAGFTSVLLVHRLAKKTSVASATFDEVLPPGCAALGAPLAYSTAPVLSHSFAFLEST
jgi:hypothetical protein